MGDIVNQQFCQRFIDEFGEELGPKYRLSGDQFSVQRFTWDDDFNIRWGVQVRDAAGVAHGCLLQHVVATPWMDAESLAESVCYLLYEDEWVFDSPEYLAVLKRAEKVTLGT